MIRIVQEREIDAVAEIWLAANLSAHRFISSKYWQDHFGLVKEMMLQAEIYVYENQSGIVGFIGLNGDYISGIFVSQEFRSYGIGKQLLDFAKTVRNTLMLDVYTKNVRAVKFYQREHFKIIQTGVDQDTREEEYRMIWTKHP